MVSWSCSRPLDLSRRKSLLTVLVLSVEPLLRMSPKLEAEVPSYNTESIEYSDRKSHSLMEIFSNLLHQEYLLSNDKDVCLRFCCQHAFWYPKENINKGTYFFFEV